MRTAVGGTFNVLHDGHKRLLDAAFDGADEVLIGITSDRMASGSRGRIMPYSMRKDGVEDYIKTKGVNWRIYEISDMYGPAAEIEDIDALVVSEETESNGTLVNGRRIEKGMHPLRMVVVGMQKGPGGNVIRASSVMSGECSRNGDRNTIRISVGSLNPVKTEAVRSVMEMIFGEVRIIPKDVLSGVPEQPWGEDTCKGAVNRARAAMDGSDMSVGIEAGVFDIYDGIYDVQHCAILDRNGRLTLGTGSGFRYPDEVAVLLGDGMSVGDAMRMLYGEDKGDQEGAVGFLSKGLLDRKTLTEQSVTAAMIPRIHSPDDGPEGQGDNNE